MTNELPAGRELDALVAKRVMGTTLERECMTFHADRCDGIHLIRCGACGRHGHGNCYGDGSGPVQVRCEFVCQAPHYSTDIAAAWEVVERMIALGYPTVTVTASTTHNGCIATVWRSDSDPVFQQGRYLETSMDSGVPAPLAICRAALAALEARHE